MADIITGTTTGYVNNVADQTQAAVSDVRREAAEHTNELGNAIKDARYNIVSEAARNTNDLARQVDAIDDTMSVAIAQVSRDTMDLRAQVTAVGYQVRDGFTAASKDAEINALKTQIELAKQSTYLSDKIDDGNAATRALINDLRDRELNRVLVERNAEILEEREGRRHWRGAFDQGQWQALNSQLQAFQSQLQETRQGVTNFGTMTGNAGRQQATNNVA